MVEWERGREFGRRMKRSSLFGPCVGNAFLFANNMSVSWKILAREEK
jgi:hypothetical protein